jgi:multidrug efflux pump subunit AcrB
MMWIVRVALRAPYTFTVLGLLLLLGGALSALQMAKDIFPAINIPVVGIIWTYNGLPAEQMAERITTLCERAATTTVNNIEHIESNSFNGINVIKIYLHEGASIDAAIAEVTTSCQTILKSLPPGITPPNILSYNAANVPILQLSVGGTKFSEQELYDFATNFIRTQLATVQGTSIPLPLEERRGRFQLTLIQVNCRPITSRRKKSLTRSTRRAWCFLPVVRRSVSANMMS